MRGTPDVRAAHRLRDRREIYTKHVIAEAGMANKFMRSMPAVSVFRPGI